MDLHWYLRALEEVAIRALSSAFAIEASRIEGLTGVWVGMPCNLISIFLDLKGHILLLETIYDV